MLAGFSDYIESLDALERSDRGVLVVLFAISRYRALSWINLEAARLS